MSTSALVKDSYRRLKEIDPNHPWGNPEMGSKVQPLGEAKRKLNAKEFNLRIQGFCGDLKEEGHCTLRLLSVKLNEIGIVTRRGKHFTRHNLYRILSYPCREYGENAE
tara:strand:- start:215 stop:538 length:324 start_codon:yes stop_codon:yes gene_type:complete